MDMIKHLPLEGLDLLSDLIRDFWLNENTDFESWHATKLSNLFKGKGDQQDPNNWQGIGLKDTTAKIVSIIITKRLMSRQKKNRITYKFGHIRCQGDLHSLRSTLMIWRHCGLKSCALFVDLVKAFDSIQHEVLYMILKKIVSYSPSQMSSIKCIKIVTYI